MTTYCFSLVIAAAFLSEYIPLERLNIGFGAMVFASYFFMHCLPYMKEKRGEEGDPLVEEAREQEHERIEEDIKKIGEQKCYLKSKIIYVRCLIRLFFITTFGLVITTFITTFIKVTIKSFL